MGRGEPCHRYLQGFRRVRDLVGSGGVGEWGYGLWGDNIAGFGSLELVDTYEAIIYDGGDSTLPSLDRVRGW